MAPHRWCTNRLFEWTMALALVAMGLHIAIVPRALVESRLESILDLIWLPLLATACCLTGIVRITGLCIGYRWGMIGFHLRAGGALVGGGIWLQLGSALIISAHELTIDVAPTVWLYTVLAASEFVSVHRAEVDGKSTACT